MKKLRACENVLQSVASPGSSLVARDLLGRQGFVSQCGEDIAFRGENLYRGLRGRARLPNPPRRTILLPSSTRQELEVLGRPETAEEARVVSLFPYHFSSKIFRSSFHPLGVGIPYCFCFLGDASMLDRVLTNLSPFSCKSEKIFNFSSFL